MIIAGLVIVGLVFGFSGYKFITRDKSGVHGFIDADSVRGCKNSGTELCKFTYEINEIPGVISYYSEVNKN